MPSRYTGWTATGCGRTQVTLDLDLDLDGEQLALLTVFARWMGDTAPLEVALRCTHLATGSHSGALRLDSAPPHALPPSDGDLFMEYVCVPPQPSGVVGSDAMAMAGHTNDTFELVLWLHPDAAYDDGTQLDPEEYDEPVETFAPVAQALGWLARPWKLTRG